MEQLFNYIYNYQGFGISHYFAVCGNTVIVDGDWYERVVMSFPNLDAIIHSITDCEYFEYDFDREFSYRWIDEINQYG